MSGHNDPKLLYAISGVKAFHIANGREDSLTPAGPQTLSLLMVPTSSPFADLSNNNNNSGTNSPEDFYLHLHLPPELDLPLPATTQIYHQPPNSYLIPRWDLGPDCGAFTRIEFPAAGTRTGVQEDVDTFETILAQCTAFLERSPPPKQASSKAAEAVSEKSRAAGSYAADETLPPYNPADYQPGEGYVAGSHNSKHAGRIVLVDEEDGSVIGELTDGYQVNDSTVKHGSKDPVEVSLPTEGNHNVTVQPASQEYIEKMMHPAYKKSFLVSNATRASRLIVTSSDMIAKGLQGGADTFSQKTQPNETPVSFSPTTQAHIRRINTFSTKAATFSAATVHHVSNYAQNIGAGLARKQGGGGKGYDKDGNVIESYKPGLLNRSFMAFSTVADGVEQAGRNLLGGTTSSVSQIVEHKWGADAGEASRNIGGGFKNVGLVYIDVTGVSRKAILKSVAKGMVVGQVADGRKVIVGGGDGGVVQESEGQKDSYASETASLRTDYEGNGKKPAKGNGFGRLF